MKKLELENIIKEEVSKALNEAQKFKNKEEVVDALVKDFGKNKKSYYNTPTNKQNEKFWTYNRTLKYYYKLVKKNESINEGKYDHLMGKEFKLKGREYHINSIEDDRFAHVSDKRKNTSTYRLDWLVKNRG